MGSPKRPIGESKSLERFCSYIAMVTSVSEFEPSTFEEAVDHQVWRDAMVEEYSSIMKTMCGRWSLGLQGNQWLHLGGSTR